MDIKSITMPKCEYALGDIVEICDTVDPAITNIGTIKLIEPDSDNPTLFWIYIIANEEVMNDKFDPKIGNFWEILEHTSYRISLISRAVL